MNRSFVTLQASREAQGELGRFQGIHGWLLETVATLGCAAAQLLAELDCNNEYAKKLRKQDMRTSRNVEKLSTIAYSEVLPPRNNSNKEDKIVGFLQTEYGTIIHNRNIY